MSTYRRYQEARDTAWRALLQIKEKRLPVDAEGLCGQIGAEVHPFPSAQEARLFRLIQQAGGGACVSLRIRGAWHIFLRQDRLDENQRRFSVAHELGHILLAHPTRSLSPGVRAFESRENQGDLILDPQDLDDYAADIFAIRLLAPACVLHEMHVDQSGQIITLCGLPPRAAALRAERMALLNERDVFYNHPLERQVRDQFLPFIRSRRTAAARESAAPVHPARSILVAPLPRPKAAEPEPPSPSMPRPQASAPETPDERPSADSEGPDVEEAPEMEEETAPSAAPEKPAEPASPAAPPLDDPDPVTDPTVPHKLPSWLWLAALTLALALLIFFLCRRE